MWQELQNWLVEVASMATPLPKINPAPMIRPGKKKSKNRFTSFQNSKTRQYTK
jgi:hypothetical protein